jgi:lipoyl(octanoyl) transferase
MGADGGTNGSDELWVCHLGETPYRRASDLQERLRARRQNDELPDLLLLLEHPPVYTRGRRSLEDELVLGADFYRARGIDVIDTNRGGRITYHGPGQLVGYPIMRIDAIDSYLRTMESAIIAALADAQIDARARPEDGPDYTGVWVAQRKIASIGVHVSHGVTMHGFAVNVNNDLEPFSWIVACGLPGVSMTSVASELGGARAIDVDRFRADVAARFCAAHGRRPHAVSPRQLGIEASAVGSPSAEALPA